MDERWLPVPGYIGLYEVSSHGRVRSLSRTVRRGKHSMRIRGVTLKQRPTPRGHREVVLHKDGKPEDCLVHVLVLTTFRGPRPPGKQTRHLDSNPSNNRDTNLAWGTQSENRLDYVALQPRRECCGYDHRLEAPNLIASALKRNAHQCKACHGTYRICAKALSHGKTIDFRTVADARYAKIMAKAG